jgi:mono/diheme cytochrome c family protein
MFEKSVALLFGLLAALLLAATVVVAQPVGEELTRLAEDGESLFRQKCIACHTIGGGDRPIGPDLAGVTERRDSQWLVAMIRDPDTLIKAGDPLANQLLQQYNNLQMPPFPLSPKEQEALLTYLAYPEEAAHHPAAEAAPRAVGDGTRGARLYTGEIAFANGGAPCLACHGIAGFGLAGGANYGPDLTPLHENFGAEGVADILTSLPFPSMEPIYATRPLTSEERADLGAFFATATGAPVARDGLLLGEVLSGTAILFGVVMLFGRERLRGVRRSLVNRVHNQGGELR